MHCKNCKSEVTHKLMYCPSCNLLLTPNMIVADENVYENSFIVGERDYQCKSASTVGWGLILLTLIEFAFFKSNNLDFTDPLIRLLVFLDLFGIRIAVIFWVILIAGKLKLSKPLWAFYALLMPAITLINIGKKQSPGS